MAESNLINNQVVSDSSLIDSQSEEKNIQSTNSIETDKFDHEEFIQKQLQENLKDRLFMLNTEKCLIDFLKNDKAEFRFASMNPYYRMLVHRISEYFGLAHNLDQEKKCIIVNKTEKTKLPTYSFQSIIKSFESFSNSSDSNQIQATTKQILKRDSTIINDTKTSKKLIEPAKIKTFEEKSADYIRIKNRIFNDTDEKVAINEHVHKNYIQPQQNQYNYQNKMVSQNNYEQYSSNQPILVNQQNRNYYQSANFYQNNYGMQQGNNFSNVSMQPQLSYYSQPYVNINNQNHLVNQQNQNFGYYQSNHMINSNVNPCYQQFQNNYQPATSQYMMRHSIENNNNNNNHGQIRNFSGNENLVHSNAFNSNQRNSLNNKPLYAQKNNKKIRNLAINENVDSFSFQLYNLKENFSRKMLQDLLNPYVNSIDFKPISNVNKETHQEELNKLNVILDEENVNVFIKFKNVDKLKEAFKLFKLNDSETASTSPKETNEKQIESPFLLRQIKIY